MACSGSGRDGYFCCYRATTNHTARPDRSGEFKQKVDVMAIRERTILLSSNVKINVQMSGDGEPVILRPGFGCRSRCFHPLMDAASTGWSCPAITKSSGDPGSHGEF